MRVCVCLCMVCMCACSWVCVCICTCICFIVRKSEVEAVKGFHLLSHQMSHFRNRFETDTTRSVWLFLWILACVSPASYQTVVSGTGSLHGSVCEPGSPQRWESRPRRIPVKGKMQAGASLEVTSSVRNDVGTQVTVVKNMEVVVLNRVFQNQP